MVGLNMTRVSLWKTETMLTKMSCEMQNQLVYQKDNGMIQRYISNKFELVFCVKPKRIFNIFTILHLA